MKTKILLAAAVALAACQTVPASTRGPAGALDLGDYQHGSESAVAGRFNGAVAARYPAGGTLARATGDLSANRFSCAAASTESRGEPPDQVCRRTISEAGCTHTWQVMLYEQRGALSRARGGYDRVCRAEDDGLLGGR